MFLKPKERTGVMKQHIRVEDEQLARAVRGFGAAPAFGRTGRRRFGCTASLGGRRAAHRTLAGRRAGGQGDRGHVWPGYGNVGFDQQDLLVEIFKRRLQLGNLHCV